MRHILPVCLLLSACAGLYAVDIDYDAELQRAIKINPPGDYGSFYNRWPPLTAGVPRVSQNASAADQMFKPVEPSDKDAKTLASEAAKYFVAGRFDLAIKCYKQWLLIEPGNVAVKARLYDIGDLRGLYADATHLSEASKKYAEMCKEISKDILSSDAK